MTLRRTAGRFREAGPIPTLAVALLLTAGAAFSQDRSETHEVDAGHGDRVAEPSEPAPPPPEPSAPSEPAASPEPSEPRSAVAVDPSPEPSDPGEPTPEPRTAVPIEPGEHNGPPSRQPPTRHDHGDGGHGGEGGNSSDSYDSFDSGSSSDGSDDDGRYFSGGVPWFRFGHGPRDEMGALDLDLSPGRTQVYLNGQRIGTVDDFDGWPRYLWLPRGRYEIAFYLDGYKTLVRRVTVYPGLVIDMDDRMERGPSIRPEDLPRPHGQ